MPDVEFTSLLFPLLVQQRLEVRIVPLGELVDVIAGGVDAVAFSAVQMSSGEVADLDAIEAAAAGVGAITLCDATQAVGWLPIQADRFDAVVCAAYKWLMSPRGTAFLTVSDRCWNGPSAQRRLVCGRGYPCQLLRAAAAPRLNSPATRRLAGLVLVGGHPARVGGDRASRHCGDPQPQSDARQSLPRRHRSAAR